MNKEEYKKSLHRHYPEEPDNVLELAWHFHGMETVSYTHLTLPTIA